MSESFNPYVEWLGLPAGRQPANHYELLGLPLFENDPHAIAQAADGQIARLRGVRPGQHVVQWQQMLDELCRVKACMTAPSVKSVYDAELCRQIESGSARPVAAAGEPSAPPQEPQLAVPPGFQPPQPAAPSFPPQAAPVPPTMAAAPPWNPAAPAAAVPIPMGVPVAKPVAGPQPVFPPPGNVEPIVVRRDVYQPRWSKSSAGLIVAQVGLIGLILVGAGFAYMLYQQRQREATARATTQTASTKETKAVTEPENPTSRPEPDKPTPPNPVEPEQPKSPPRDDSPVETTAETKPDHPEVKPAVKPAAIATEPPAKPEASLDPQKQRALKQALTDVRASLAEADLQAAQNLLTTAAKYVQSDDDKAEVGRLESLTHNLGEFWKTMGQIVGKLQAMDEIPVRDYQVIVVEVGRNRLAIKAAGQVREYSPLSQMPHLLVTALADWQFGKDPQSKAVYASYLALAPKGDRQRARQLWQEAIDAGVDVRYLLPELDHPPGRSGNGAKPKRR